MLFGLYTPAQVTTVGSPEIQRQIEEALQPLPPGGKDAQLAICEDIVFAADEARFDLALFAERHLGPDLSAWVMASAVGSRMRHMRSLVAVHPGLWHPAMIAKIAASVDRITERRMAINIVNGWYEREFEIFGGHVLEGDARYRRSAEFIDVVRRLWTEDRVTHHGEFYRLEDAGLPLRPATATPPEFFSVSSSEPGRDFIAQSCDWWFITAPKTPDLTETDLLRAIECSIAEMHRRTRDTGRKVRLAYNPFMALADSTQAALDRAIESIFAYDRGPESRSADRARQIERRMLPATKAGFMGRPDDVCRQVRRFEDMGVELLLLKFIPTVETVRTIGDEVISRVGSRSLESAAAS